MDLESERIGLTEEKRIARLKQLLKSLETKIPTIRLRRIEESIPILKEVFTLKIHNCKRDGGTITQLLSKHQACQNPCMSILNNTVIHGYSQKFHSTNVVTEAMHRKNFNQKRNFKTHQPIHSGKHSLQCGKSFSCESNLKIRHYIPSETFKCEICGKSFKRKVFLKKHQMWHRPNERPFKCDICSKGFHRKDILKNHLQVHNVERSFKCDTCSKSYAYLRLLKKHQIIHNSERPYKCDSCDHSYYHKSSLKLHQKIHGVHQTIHGGEVSFRCDTCGKSFPMKGYLRIHQLFHSGERTFKCDACDKSFIVEAHLRRHQLIHSSERRYYKCDTCSKMFSRQDNLKKHQLGHSGENKVT